MDQLNRSFDAQGFLFSGRPCFFFFSPYGFVLSYHLASLDWTDIKRKLVAAKEASFDNFSDP